MEELAKDVFTAPLGTIFVLAGVLFLLIAVVGKISGKIEPGQKERVLSGILGSAFITIGLAMYWWSLPAPTVPAPLSPEKTRTTKADKEITSSQPPVAKPQGGGEQKGDTSSSAGSAGDNIPDWVPEYPASVENLSVKRREGGGQYGNFFFISTEQPDAVLNFYQTSLEINRWEVTKKDNALSAVNEGGSQTITVTSGKTGRPFIPPEWKYVVAFSESKRK